MIDEDLINKIRQFKFQNHYTLHELSGIVDIQISTLERWFRTNRINRLYAKTIKEKLKLD